MQADELRPEISVRLNISDQPLTRGKIGRKTKYVLLMLFSIFSLILCILHSAAFLQNIIFVRDLEDSLRVKNLNQLDTLIPKVYTIFPDLPQLGTRVILRHYYKAKLYGFLFVKRNTTVQKPATQTSPPIVFDER